MNKSDDTISRQDAIKIVDQFSREEMFHYMESLELDARATQICHSAIEAVGTIKEQIESLPSADRPTTDCTEFVKWLTEVVLDEEDWRMNPDAYGEVICRKLKKLGLLDVEDGYYVDTRPTVDKEYLIDLIQEAVYDGEACAKLIDMVDRPTGEWGIKTETDKYGLKRPKLVCSKCEKEPAAWDLTELFEFCPNCGAKMVREDGEKE